MNRLSSLAGLLLAILVASVGVSKAGTAAPSSAPVVGEVHRDADVGDILKIIEEHLKRFTVSVHNLAVMRDGLAREIFTDDERARLGDIFAITNSFRKSLGPAFFVGPLVSKMRLPEDADTVRQTFYYTAQNAYFAADSNVKDVNRYMTDIRNAAVLTEVTKVRDSMTAIRDILQAVPKYGKDASH